MVEFLTGALSLFVWLHVSSGRLTFGLEGPPLLEVGMAFFLYFYFVAILIVIAFIDLDRTIIPHELTGAGAVLGIVTAFVIPRSPILADIWPMIHWYDALLGCVVGAGIIASLILGYKLIKGVEGMGWGDFWLMGMVGFWLGWKGVVVVLFLASIQGLIAALGHKLVFMVRGEDASGGGFFIDDIDAVDDWDGRPRVSDDESPAPSEGLTSGEGTVSELEEDAEEVGFGQLAVPFGPFIALAAVEYLLLGHWLLPRMLF